MTDRSDAPIGDDAAADDIERGPIVGETADATGDRMTAILARVLAAPRRERNDLARSEELLQLAAGFDEDGPEWRALYAELRRAGVLLREWRSEVRALRRPDAAQLQEHDDDRPEVRFDPSRLDRATTAAIAHLAGSDRNLYQRAGGLAFVVSTTREDIKRFPFMGEGAPRIVTMTGPTLAERLCAAVRFKVFRGEHWITRPPPPDVSAAILARGAWPGVRPLRGILETPTIRPIADGGAVVDRPGYDDSIGYLYRPPHGTTFPAVPVVPTREDARRALDMLTDVFVDFPFETPEGRSVAVAATLTMIARPAIEGNVPVFAFDATTQGTGKSLAVDAIHKIATGRVTGKMPLPTDRQNPDDAEIRKALSAAALAGALSVTFDNVGQNAPLGGPALEAVITCGEHEGRILGTLQLFRVRWEAVLFATGNNVSVTPDMNRRTLAARMTSPFERPEHRPADSYVHPDRAGVDLFLAWLATERPRLVTAGLTLLRAFIVAGAPPCARAPGSFESWAKLVASAIVWAGGADPTACLLSSEAAEERPELAALRVVLRDLPRLDPSARGVTVKELLAFLYPPERTRGEVLPPDGFADLREALEVLVPPTRPNAPPDVHRLGNHLAGLRGRVLGGLSLDRALTGAKGSVARWVVSDRRGASGGMGGMGGMPDTPTRARDSFSPEGA